MAKVLNKRWAKEVGIYIGRPSKWGNKFSHMDNTLAQYKVASRDEAVDKYEEWIRTQPELLNALDELVDQNLVCWCAPARCHGDVLLKLIDERKTKKT